MKKTTTLLFFVITSLSIVAQSAAAWDAVPLEKDKDYKTAVPKIKECVAYLLNHPFSKEDAKSVSASKLLLKWMTGTPDYSFNMLGNITKIDPEGHILPAYLAASVKVGLESPENLKDLKKGELATMKIVAEYLSLIHI